MKRQVSVNESLISLARKHPLYTPGKGEGQGASGLINLALSWALQPAQEASLKAHQASFALEELKAQREALEAQIAALEAPAAKPAKGAKK